MNEHEKNVGLLIDEYKEMRQELRDNLKAMDTNLATAIIAVGALFTAAFQWQNLRIICIVPTVMFFFIIIQFVKALACATLGAYCRMIADKIKAKVPVDEVLLEWEGGPFWQSSFGVTGVVQQTLYLIVFPILLAFIVISAFSFRELPWSLPVHVLELEILLFVLYRWYRVVAARQCLMRGGSVTLDSSSSEPEDSAK